MVQLTIRNNDRHYILRVVSYVPAVFRCGVWPLVRWLGYPWSSQMFFQAIELLAYPRRSVLSRRNPSRWRTLLLPHLFALLRWLLWPLLEFLDTRTVSSSAEFRSFLLGMCIEASESTTHCLSLGFVEGWRCQAPNIRRREERSLCPLFELEKYLLPFPTRLCERIVLASRFLLHIYPQISEHEGCALTSTNVLNHTLRRTLSFPNFHVV